MSSSNLEQASVRWWSDILVDVYRRCQHCFVNEVKFAGLLHVRKLTLSTIESVIPFCGFIYLCLEPDYQLYIWMLKGYCMRLHIDHVVCVLLTGLSDSGIVGSRFFS